MKKLGWNKKVGFPLSQNEEKLVEGVRIFEAKQKKICFFEDFLSLIVGLCVMYVVGCVLTAGTLPVYIISSFPLYGFIGTITAVFVAITCESPF